MTIEGIGDAEKIVMTDKACEGKAILVIRGENTTVRNLTLTRARVPDENGAGIRGESKSIVIDKVRFINNQNGILSGTDGGSMIIKDSYFEKNGFCGGACSHGVYAGHLDLLHIENSRFFDTQHAHHIKSRARRTEVIGCDIEDGPDGTASYEVEAPNGGSLIVRDSKIIKGPNAENHTAAIMIGSEGVTQMTPEIIIANNTFPQRRQLSHHFRRQLDRHRGPTLRQRHLRQRPGPAAQGRRQGPRQQVRHLCGLAAASLLIAAPAAARTLLVGAEREYKLPSDAMAAAHDGDTISIAPGEYFDCAIVRPNDLTIQGESDTAPAVITDKVCEEKALLVLRGNNMTIRNLTLQRARAPDGNGAGIRLESPDLKVDNVRFINDQVGILSGSSDGTIAVTNSQFTQGGVGGLQPKYALMIDHSAHLIVTGCIFTDVKGGQITTAARRSDIVDDRLSIGAGDPEEDPSYAVLATDGVLTMDRDVITVGPVPPRPGAAIGMWDDTSGENQPHPTGQPNQDRPRAREGLDLG